VPVAKLLPFQHSVYSDGIKISSIVTCGVASLVNGKAQFVLALRRYLNVYPFYSADGLLTYENYSLLYCLLYKVGLVKPCGTLSEMCTIHCVLYVFIFIKIPHYIAVE
jgi:hypothetical protein